MKNDCETATNQDKLWYKSYYQMGICLTEEAKRQDDIDNFDKMMQVVIKYLEKALALFGKENEINNRETLNQAIKKAEAIRILKTNEFELSQKDEQLIYLEEILNFSEISNECENEKVISDLKEIFSDEARKMKMMAPDCICCPITLEAVKDPTVTPDGISYDQISIQQLMARGNFVDPTTRNQFHPNQLVSNTHLKQFSIEWVQKHPEHEFGSNYLKIAF